ncbi:MAG: aminotransferase class I/II-fold pyridoxal phosphate-dependent enzyme, partial [Gemmatimonadetes bacterium]|nr:aminotransferase class I/II-fold pyridoxal phosphate-dependent enzyme [Gemmatimonadota bacterium]
MPDSVKGSFDIPLSVPEIAGNEWDYVKECLDTGWVSSAGGYVTRFEEALRTYVGADHGVAMVNGTCALQIALLVAGVEPGDEVVVPALTFIAPVNAVRYVGAFPVFMDCDQTSLCLDVEKLTEFLTTRTRRAGNGDLLNRDTGRRIRAVVPVHVFGHPAEMDPLVKLCRELGLKVIEDAAESLGSTYRGHQTGTLGDVGVFSFNGNKLVT